MILRFLNSAMCVGLLFATFLVFNMPIASSLEACVAADEVPADVQLAPLEPTKAEPPPARIKVNLTPILSVLMDVRRIEVARVHAQEILQKEPSGAVFDLDQWSPIDLNTIPESVNPQSRMEIYAAYPTQAVVVDTVNWTTIDKIQEMLSSEGDQSRTTESVEAVIEQESATIVHSENYVAVRMVDGEVYTDNAVSDLRKLLLQTEQMHAAKAISISCKPRAIARSAVKPFIDGLRAVLATNSQQLDDEDGLSAIGRPLFYRMQTGILSALFDDTESLEYSFDYSPTDRHSVVELQFTTARGTDFDRYISRLSDTRNRSLAYLHPDQTSFLTAAVPLPELLSSILPQLSVVFLNAVQEELNLPVADVSAVGSVMNQFAESKQVDFLVQAVPTSADSNVSIFVLPLTSASSLESTSIQLAANIDDQTWQRNVGEVAGFPIHKLTLEDTEIFFTLTDDCVAAMVGPEVSLSVLEKVVTRNFEQSPSANRFARSAFAVQGSAVEASKLGLHELSKRLAERLNEDGRSSLEDKFEFSLQTEPHQLSVRATFEPDALMLASETFELGIEALSQSLDALD